MVCWTNKKGFGSPVNLGQGQTKVHQRFIPTNKQKVYYTTIMKEIEQNKNGKFLYKIVAEFH
jgi:hypothetical protein